MKEEVLTGEIPRIAAIDAEAIESLLVVLGPVKTAAFVREHMWAETDYVKLKDELFRGTSIEAIAEEIQARRNAEKLKF